MRSKLKFDILGSQQDFTEVLYRLQKDKTGFQQLAAILKSVAGINMLLNDKNLSLMAGRLISIMRKYNLGSYAEYVPYLNSKNQEMLTEFISQMTTNTTEFFRENDHFEVLRNKLPDIVKRMKDRGDRDLRVWCAACSSGQEAYTLGIVISQSLPEFDLRKLKLLATDIDFEILQKAMAGVYSNTELKGVSLALRQKYFSSVGVGRDGDKCYQVIPELRDQIQFASFNLITSEYPFKHDFDVIFCRNVFIYFDKATQQMIIERFIKHLRPGGLLFLGHSESGMVKSDRMKTVSYAVYQKS
jgi:chemotaxis protein methyltransferase CheR